MSQRQNTPRVSVIIPAYNAASFIAATLKSAIDQTFRDFEIIVIDDGSTDETRVIVERYKDSRVFLISQQNAGPGAARNRGIAVAKGTFIALLDSDDLWEPTYLETMVDFLTPHPETSVVFPDALYFGKSKFHGKRFQEVYPPGAPITFAKLVRGASNICYSATLRREIFDCVGPFDEADAIRGTEDFDLWLRVLHAGYRIEPVMKVLVRYRRHASSLSLQGVSSILSVLQALEKWRGDNALTSEESDAVEAAYAKHQYSLNVALAIDNIRFGQYSTASELLLRAHAHMPKRRFQIARAGLAIAPGIVRFAVRALTP
jgi:glycosyltransferase involved in cell wall biosynthesis